MGAVVIQIADGNNKKNGYCNLNAIAIFLGCIINSVDGIKKFYHHYFLIKKS